MSNNDTSGVLVRHQLMDQFYAILCRLMEMEGGTNGSQAVSTMGPQLHGISRLELGNIIGSTNRNIWRDGAALAFAKLLIHTISSQLINCDNENDDDHKSISIDLKRDIERFIQSDIHKEAILSIANSIMRDSKTRIMNHKKLSTLCRQSRFLTDKHTKEILSFSGQIEAFDKLIEVIEEFELENCFEMKPLLSGNILMEVISYHFSFLLE